MNSSSHWSKLLLLGLLGAGFAGGLARANQRPGPEEDLRRETLTDQKRNESIEQLRRIIPKIDDTNTEKAELLYQLAELYREKSNYLLNTELARYESEYRGYEQARQRGQKVEPPKEDHRGSEQYRVESMKLYEQVLREYPNYARVDEVLFALGFNLYEIGRREQAVTRYLELLRRHPNSRFAGDTYLQLGNHYFDVANDLSRSREYFQKALRSDIPKVHSYALYKLAWCDYNSGDFEEALSKLQRVVDYAETRGAEMVDLKNEALGDTVPIFVGLGRSEQAIAYFGQKAPKRKFKLVAALATQLADAGQYEASIKTFQSLISEEPNRPEAPEYQQGIIRGYEGLRRRDRVKLELRQLVELYGPGSEWWKANQSRKEVQRNAFNVTEEAMRSIVTEYHQEAQRTKQVQTYRLARDIYEQYLRAFGSGQDENLVSDQAFNIRFYYAEILWALEDWAVAAAQYDAVVAFAIPNRESAREVSQEGFRKLAAYDAILAYDKLVKLERGEVAKSELKPGQKVSEQKTKGSIETGKIERLSPGELKEQPLTGNEQSLISAVDRYLRMFPKSTDEIELRYLAAVILYERRHLPEAAQRFSEITVLWPEERRSQQAADLTLHILELRGDWIGLNRVCRQFLSNPRLAKPGTEFTRRVATVLEGSQYKWINEVTYRQEKNPAKAARELMKFIADFPGSPNEDRALAFATLMFGEAHQLEPAIAAGEQFLRSYGRSPFELKVRYGLARSYERAAEFQKAAAMYESFVASFDRVSDKTERMEQKLEKSLDSTSKSKRETDERRQLLDEAESWLSDAQYNAALWWEALGRTDRAVAAYRQYISRFGDRKDVPDVQYRMAALYERARRWKDAVNAYEEFKTRYGQDKRTTAVSRYLATYRQLLAHRRLGESARADRRMEELLRGVSKLIRADRKSAPVMDAYAHARFLKLDSQWKQYSESKLARLSTLKQDLRTKRAKLKELEKAYASVVEIGSAEHGIASLARIGMAYADMAQNITHSPSPKGLTREQLQMYRNEIENLAQPLEQKAVEVFEAAISKASDLQIYSEWTLAAQDKINQYKPGSFPRVREVPYQGGERFASAPLEKDARVGLAKTAATTVPNR
jgi:tetratricopeptide (TPR) repeat protein